MDSPASAANLRFKTASLRTSTYYDLTIGKVNVGGTQKTSTHFFRIVP
jgi:hypothetical protein